MTLAAAFHGSTATPYMDTGAVYGQVLPPARQAEPRTADEETPDAVPIAIDVADTSGARVRLAPAPLPLVPYPVTVCRPGWDDLPWTVRMEIGTRLRQPVVDAITTQAGFTPNFASVLVLADGSRVFCKAAEAGMPAGAAYLREARIAALLPEAVPAARLRWYTEHHGYVIACYDAVDGLPPGPGWTVGELESILAAHVRTSRALTAPAPSLRAVASGQPALPAGWADVAGGHRALPAQVAHLAAFAPLLRRWEGRFLARCRSATSLAHFDLRPDNCLVSHSAAGRVWIVDWVTLRPGPGFIDTAILAVAAASDGYDPQQLFDAAALGASGRDLDQALAWLSGAWLTYAAGPPSPNSPHLRTHQLRSGLLAWRWLAGRHGFR